MVEKNTMFLVSRGLSLEKSGVRVWGSDSPVREELSTWGTKGEARIKDQTWSLARRARKIAESLLAHHRKEHEREHFGVKITVLPIRCEATVAYWSLVSHRLSVLSPCSRERRWFSGQRGSCRHPSPPPGLRPPHPRRWCCSSRPRGWPGLAVTQGGRHVFRPRQVNASCFSSMMWRGTWWLM